MAEARAIVTLSDLIRSARPSAALRRRLAGHLPEDPLFIKVAADLAITAVDVQVITAALKRALGPADHFRSAGRGIAPKPAKQAIKKYNSRAHQTPIKHFSRRAFL